MHDVLRWIDFELDVVTEAEQAGDGDQVGIAGAAFYQFAVGLFLKGLNNGVQGGFAIALVGQWVHMEFWAGIAGADAVGRVTAGVEHGKALGVRRRTWCR